MHKYLFFLLLSSTIIMGNEIDLGVIGAKGEFIRFGNDYKQNDNLMGQYLLEIAERRNRRILETINKNSSPSLNLDEIESDFLKDLYEN